MKKTLSILCAAALICALLTAFAPMAFAAAPSFTISEKKLYTREEGLEIKGSYPQIVSDSNAPLIIALREDVEAVYQAKKMEAKESKAKSIVFSYTFTESDGVSSLLLYAIISTATSKAEVVSINFDRIGQRRVYPDDVLVLGANGMSLADKFISRAIKDKPDHYYQNFTGITKSAAFVVENGEVTLMFDAFKLAPGSEGIVSFTMRKDMIVDFALPKEDYIIDESNYDLRMIPLRVTAEALGFEVNWNSSEENRYVIVRRGDDLKVTLYLNKNTYLAGRPASAERPASRTLESAPELVSSVTFVPISFFDQVLELVSFSIDEDETIIFSTYRD